MAKPSLLYIPSLFLNTPRWVPLNNVNGRVYSTTWLLMNKFLFGISFNSGDDLRETKIMQKYTSTCLKLWRTIVANKGGLRLWNQTCSMFLLPFFVFSVYTIYFELHSSNLPTKMFPSSYSKSKNKTLHRCSTFNKICRPFVIAIYVCKVS